MSLILTEETRLLASQTEVGLNIILEIDGFPQVFGAAEVSQDLMFDMLDNQGDPMAYFDSTYNFDGGISHPQSRPLISLPKTTNNITQQIDISRGVEGIKVFTVSLIDYRDELTELFRPGNIQSDILGRQAIIYLSLMGSEHPSDSVEIMTGIIGSCSFEPGLVLLQIDHSSQLKRQDLFTKGTTTLTSSVNNSVTAIPVSDTSDFLVSTDAGVISHYLRIDDEIMLITDRTTTNFTVTRGQLDTAAVEHDDEEDVLSIYRVQGGAVELSLKMMLSGSGFGTSSNAMGFVTISSTLSVANAIHFSNENDVETKYGLVAGDFLKVTGSDDNNGTFTAISFGKTNYSSYVVVAETLTDSVGIEQEAVVQFKSKYDTLGSGFGCGLSGNMVDIPKHEEWEDLFSDFFIGASYDFHLDDTIEFDSFLQQELYRPVGLYSLPGSRASCKLTIPPLADVRLKILNEDTVRNPDKIAIKRSISKFYFNSVIYKYNPHSTEQSKYLSGIITIDADSSGRIRFGEEQQPNRPFKILSRGLRNTATVRNLLSIQAKRFLDRYAMAASHLKLEIMFSTGFQLQVGDVVAIEGLQISDSTKGSRSFGPRLFEIINLSLSISSARVVAELLDTNYSTEGRWGVVSPSSKIKSSGSTTTMLPLEQSFYWTKEENEKWGDHIGQKALVHSDDYIFSEEITITGFDPTNENNMLISPALSSAPSGTNYVVDVPSYSTSTDPEINALYKTLYCFSQPVLTITGVTSDKIFAVSVSDALLIEASSAIEVHSPTYDSKGEAIVSSIVGQTITLEESLLFTPEVGYSIQLVTWLDGGKPYRVL